MSEVLKNAFPGIFPAILSDDSSNEKDADSDADIFSTKPLESEDETTSELIQRGKEIKKTLQYVNAFLDSTKDKHFFEVPITPLKGRENWDSWVAAVEVVLRMQQVWVLFVEEIVPLDKQHEMYVWYDRMLDVGMAVILKNVAAPIREHPCFIRSLVQRDPAGMMGHLWAHYGDVDGDDSESELYSE